MTMGIEHRCACNCGQPAARGSRYASGHFQFWTAIRRRFRALRRYAWTRGLEFNISEADLAVLIGDRWQNLRGVAIRRIDRRTGIVAGNLRLGRGRSPRPESETRVRRRFAKFLRRSSVARDLSVEELENLYAAQQGRCWLSGRRLRLKRGTKHPSALAIVKIDPAGECDARNVKLVVRAVRLALEWGEDYLVALSRDIVLRADERRATAAAKHPGPGCE